MFSDYKIPKADLNLWRNRVAEIERLNEAELLLASVLDFANDIPDEDKISNENYIILQRLAGRIEQFLGDSDDY